MKTTINRRAVTLVIACFAGTSVAFAACSSNNNPTPGAGGSTVVGSSSSGTTSSGSTTSSSGTGGAGSSSGSSSGCYDGGAPMTNDQFLNACDPSTTCQTFNGTLPGLTADGGLPPLP